MIHAIYRKGVFEPITPVELPEDCEVEFEPSIVQAPTTKPTLDDVYAILSERYRSGEHDGAERHNEHQP
jgi:predicted DNA-binding antitoxin AbrB/MazE fold protein